MRTSEGTLLLCATLVALDGDTISCDGINMRDMGDGAGRAWIKGAAFSATTAVLRAAASIGAPQRPARSCNSATYTG